jgi:hypothetical protein
MTILRSMVFLLVIVAGGPAVAGNKHAPLPPPAQACNTPAAGHNPHCASVPEIDAASGLAALAALGAALALVRERRRAN